MYTVNSDDLVNLDIEAQDLPYLKHIDLIQYTPQHFGLDRWQSQFIIPDNWMKKLYKNDVYIDTELEPKPDTEKLSEEQRKILYDYLRKRNRSGEFETKTRTRRFSARVPVDQLIDDLEKIGKRPRKKVVSFSKTSHQDNSRQSPLVESKSSNIAVCRKHRVQSEEDIVNKAIDKMKDLSPEKEAEYQSLLKDEEFMRYLNNRVESFLKSAD